MAMPRFLACSRKLPASAEKRRCAMLSLAWKAGKHLAIGVKGLPRRAAVSLGSTGLGEPPHADRHRKEPALILTPAMLTCRAIRPGPSDTSPTSATTRGRA